MKDPKENLVKIRVILVHEYLANPENYDTTDPEEMCQIDAENWRDVPESSYEAMFCPEDSVKIIVEAPDHGVSYGPVIAGSGLIE